MKLKKNINDHDHSNKYVTTQKFNKLASESFPAKLAQPSPASKNGITDFLKRQILMIN